MGGALRLVGRQQPDTFHLRPSCFGDPLDASTPTTPGSIARRSTKFINLVGVTGSLLTVQGVTDPDGTALS